MVGFVAGSVSYRGSTVGCASRCSQFAGRAVVAPRRRCAARISMAADEVLEKAEERMMKTIESVKNNFNTVRTGRANTSILDRVTVEYYGTQTPLKQLASINTPSSNTLQIDPFDKSAMGDIERALMEADLGMNPNNDGKVIRLIVPPLTKERRKELGKVVKGLAEDGRVAVRNIRRDVVDSYKKMEKEGNLSEDDSKFSQSEAQKLTNKYVKIIDELAAEKDKDISTV